VNNQYIYLPAHLELTSAKPSRTWCSVYTYISTISCVPNRYQRIEWNTAKK